ncbi:MAG: hypothetical protein QOF98_1245 [Streptomyces sp.]|nr:hypothetical protein [Streptomyces sp.]
MSAQDPQDQHLDASVPSASGAKTAAPSAPAPSVRDLLAAGAAARAVSTPPDDRPASARTAAARTPEVRAEEEPAHRASDRDAA